MRPTAPCSAGYHPQVRRLRIVSQGRAAAEKAGEAEEAAAEEEEAAAAEAPGSMGVEVMLSQASRRPRHLRLISPDLA